MFADDLKLFHRDESLLQQGLDAVHRWSLRWQLPLNINKLELLRLGRQSPEHNLTVGGEPRKESDKARDLGVLVDRKLSFKDHVNKSKQNVSLTFSYAGSVTSTKLLWPDLFRQLSDLH